MLGVRRLTGPGAAAGGLSGEARGHRASCSHTKREAHPAVGVPWPWSLPQRAPRTWRASQLRAHWSRWRGQALPTILTSFPFSGHRTACPGERPAAVVSGRVRPRGHRELWRHPGLGSVRSDVTPHRLDSAQPDRVLSAGRWARAHSRCRHRDRSLGVELPDQILLVDLAHLIPRDLLHQQEPRGHSVGGQEAPGPLLEVSVGQ